MPRIFGPYEPIRRDYPIEEYLSDVSGAGVAASVYVQTNWPRDRAVDEVAWVQSVADRTGWPHAIVGYVDLLADDSSEHRDRGRLPSRRPCEACACSFTGMTTRCIDLRRRGL